MVAMNVWPTDAADGSVSSEARWRKMARLWAPSGVAPGIGGLMAPTLAFPNLTIKSGAAWVDGAYCELPGDQVLAVTANGLTVVRFDPAMNTADLVYRDGVTVPAQDMNGTWELPIAKIVGSALIDMRNPVNVLTSRKGTNTQYNGGSNYVIATVTTPVVPVGKIAVAFMQMHYSWWNSPGTSFDIAYITPFGTSSDQIVTTIAATQFRSATFAVPGAGNPMTFTLQANAWAGGITINQESAVTVLILPT